VVLQQRVQWRVHARHWVGVGFSTFGWGYLRSANVDKNQPYANFYLRSANVDKNQRHPNFYLRSANVDNQSLPNKSARIAANSFALPFNPVPVAAITRTVLLIEVAPFGNQ
jgi:hypothetical protein